MKNSQDVMQQNLYQFKTNLAFWSRSWSTIETLKPASDEKVLSAIIKASDRYQSRQQVHKSPWTDPEFQLSYLAYFMPLNALRIQSVLAEAAKLNFFNDTQNILDFGSGSGTFHYAYLDLLQSQKYALPTVNKWIFIESETQAAQIHRQLLSQWSQPTTNMEWKNKWAPSGNKNSLAVFSYSLNELYPQFNLLPEFDSLLIIEPSTQNWGRRLQELRAVLIKKGYFIWAPCVHQMDCPLLTKSKTDWCHHRIHIELPEELQVIHDQLPIKNKSLTFSYLLAKKTPPPALTNTARMIGDTLYERGKVRQAICRNSDREFLSWLTKHGEPKVIPRGTVLPLDFEFEKKGDELRVIKK